NNFTMLQLASATGMLANNGVKMKPHLVRQVTDVVTRQSKDTLQEIKAELAAKPANIDIIRRALVGVNTEGTGATAFRGAGYVAAGKTGTAQVVTVKQNEKYDAARVAERNRDHALYMAFAPADDPKIALAMVVENAGWGGANAAPIARRVFDYWLMDQYPSEEDLAAVQKGQAQAPIGAPRKVEEVKGLPDVAQAMPKADKAEKAEQKADLQGKAGAATGTRPAAGPETRTAPAPSAPR
ncbi:MAG: penicillin-binding protein 2, partial [Curvibacter sp.]|nr:penicillin-binding protein 2 [Curvibacter sp.]